MEIQKEIVRSNDEKTNDERVRAFPSFPPFSSPFPPLFSPLCPGTEKITPQLLRRGHANLLCIVPILVYVFRMEYTTMYHRRLLYTWSIYNIYSAAVLN